MASVRPYHTPLVAVFPVLAFYSANVGLFPLSDLARPVTTTLVVSLALFLLMAAAFKSLERGAWIATIGAVAFWLSSPVFGKLAANPFIGWGFVAISAIIAAIATTRWEPPTRVLNRFALVLILVSSGSVAIKSVRPAIDQAKVASSGGPTPDIFFMVVDGYGREDQLERVMHFDNSLFVDALEERGFLVVRKSHSNYCQTALSLAATLNLTWVQDLLPTGTDNRGDISALVDRPIVVRELRAKGYETIAISTGFPGFTFDGYDLVIRDPEAVSYFESTLLEMTPIRMPAGLKESQYKQKQDSLKHAFEQLKNLNVPTAKPRFIFAHIMAPHPPFVFDAQGNPIRPKGPFGYWDGSDYMSHIGNVESYREGYVGQLTWLNGELLKLLDKLRDGSIVIIQGDHGSKLGLDQDLIEKTDLSEVFGNLAAYKVPPSVRAQLTEDITPLNAVRAIVGFVTGRDYERLPNRSYYSPFNRPTEFVDVTDRLTEDIPLKQEGS